MTREVTNLVLNTHPRGWQGMPRAACIASPFPAPTQPHYFGVSVPRGEREQGSTFPLLGRLPASTGSAQRRDPLSASY